VSAPQTTRCAVCRAVAHLIDETETVARYRCPKCNRVAARALSAPEPTLPLGQEGENPSDAGQARLTAAQLERVVQETLGEWRRLDVDQAVAEHQFRQAVRAALAGGVLGVRLAQLTGLTKQRISQIRNHRR